MPEGFLAFLKAPAATEGRAATRVLVKTCTPQRQRLWVQSRANAAPELRPGSNCARVCPLGLPPHLALHGCLRFVDAETDSPSTGDGSWAPGALSNRIPSPGGGGRLSVPALLLREPEEGQLTWLGAPTCRPCTQAAELVRVRTQGPAWPALHLTHMCGPHRRRAPPLQCLQGGANTRVGSQCGARSVTKDRHPRGWRIKGAPTLDRGRGRAPRMPGQQPTQLAVSKTCSIVPKPPI